MIKAATRKAYALITTLIIIMTSLMVFLLSTQVISNSGLKSSLANRLGTEAHFVAETCLEDTLINLKLNTDYTGGELNVADGYCTITVSDTAPGEKDIQVEASTLNTYFQHLSVEVGIIDTTETKEVYIINKAYN
jgi:hypothetical protein